MALSPWIPIVVTTTAVVLLTTASFIVPHPDWDREVSVAFVGNSIIFYNDLPRFMQELSGGRISQNSCLRSAATLCSILEKGNGMAVRFQTENALQRDGFYDFGACTVHQLLFGYYRENNDYTAFVYDEDVDDDDDGPYIDDYYRDDAQNDNDEDDMVEESNNYAYSSNKANPCYRNKTYMEYLEDYYSQDENIPNWDFVIINDMTRSPALDSNRQSTIECMKSTYGSWMQEMHAVPIFLQTVGYWNENFDMSSFVDIPTFTYLTYEGYREFANVLAESLPNAQAPRVAPVGNAFLLVWEENYEMWETLFHVDGIHPSPAGTFLQGCVLYATMYGRMPLKQNVILDDMSVLWSRARRMQPPDQDPNPWPTRQDAEYLYHIAQRVALRGHVPKSFDELDSDVR